MSKRSYQQFCPLAYSLDLIGERWTLLIIRELSLGPRRFGDLQRGLPTMGPNLLSTRLKELVEGGVVAREYLPPPARATAYGLTPAGQELLQAIGPLAKWGLRFLHGQPPADHFLSPIAVAGSLRVAFDKTRTQSVDAEIQLLPDIFTATPTDAGLKIELGQTGQAELVVATESKMLFALISGALPAAKGVSTGQIELKRGDSALLEQFVAQFDGSRFLATS